MVERVRFNPTVVQPVPVKRERVRLNDATLLNSSTLVTVKEPLVKETIMTPEELVALAQDIFGENWKAKLAAELDVYVSTVNRWVNGQTPISRRNSLAIRMLRVEFTTQRKRVNAA